MVSFHTTDDDAHIAPPIRPLLLLPVHSVPPSAACDGAQFLAVATTAGRVWGHWREDSSVGNLSVLWLHAIPPPRRQRCVTLA